MEAEAATAHAGRVCWPGLTAWVVLALCVAAGATSLWPPSPIAASAPPVRFSAERALEHVRVIAREPHPMGSQALAEVRTYLVRELGKLGVAVELHRFTAPDFYRQGQQVPVVNILARLPGTASTKAVALMAHYDTVPTTAGANDNAAAVATLLETARALRAGPALRNDVLLVFTDAEEPLPRHGVNAVVRNRAIVDAIGLVVNFEASGGCGASLLAETSGPERWLVEELAASGCPLAAFSFLTETSRLMGDIGTDFDCFRNAGVTGLHFVYLHGSPIYHTPADEVCAVSLGSLQHHGAYALGIARHFGSLDLAPERGAGRAVFFRAGPLFVRYPTTWAVPFALLAAVLFAVSLWRRETSRAGAIAGAARTVLGGLLATLVGTLLWFALTAVQTRPGVLESYLYLVGILIASGWLAGKVAGRRDQRPGYVALGLVVLFALLTAIWLPGWSYLFAWPALAACAALFVPHGWLRYVLVGATTAIVMTPAIALFFQFAQPRPGNPGSEMPSVVTLPLLLALLSLALLRMVWPRPALAVTAGPQAPPSRPGNR